MIDVIRPYLPRLAAAAVAGVAAEVCGVGLVAAAAWMIARAAEQPPLAALGLAIVVVRACALFKGVFRYAERLAGHDATLRVLAQLRVRAFEALARCRQPIRDGDALNRVVADVDAVHELLLRCLLPVTAALAVGGATTACVTAVHPAAGAILVLGLTVGGALLPAALFVAARKVGARVAAARERLTAVGLDVIEGAEDLAAFGATDRAAETASRAAESLARLERRSAALAGATTAAGIVVQATTALAVLFATRSEGTVTAATLTLTALVAAETVLPLAAAAQHLTTALPAARDVNALLATPALPPADTPLRIPPGPLTVFLAGVHASYEGRPALRGIDLTVERGRRIAVVGASGAGKSSLLAAIAGDLPVTGTLHLAGSAPDRYAQDDLRRAARGLSQDDHIFTASLRANLLLARPDATDTDLDSAAQRAHFLDYVNSLPTRWDTEVGPATLSGGQRQRLLLTRAFLADPQLLLLDEPTEALDTDTADTITRDLLTSLAGGTVVLVTHRLAALTHADEILVMDTGRIVQRGPHSVLSTTPGPYRDLLEAELLTGPSPHPPPRRASTRP